MYGALDVPGGEFCYVSAGHPGPVHLPRDGRPAVLKNPGFPVGLTEEAYTERTVRLAAGDRLFLYSDGLPEAMGAAGEPYGDARLPAAIDRGRSVPLATAVADLLADVVRWSGESGPQDDVSIVATELAAPPVENGRSSET